MPTHYQGTPQENRTLDAFIKLTRAADSLHSRLAQRKTWGDLTASQFGVLDALYHLGPMRPGEICAKQLKSGGNITLVVDNLQKRGLIRRVRNDNDRRVVIISLTEAGQRAIQERLPDHVADLVEEMSILSSKEQETLGRLCRILGTQSR